jgi:hypothetical protein
MKNQFLKIKKLLKPDLASWGPDPSPPLSGCRWSTPSLAFAVTWKPLPLVDAAAGLRRDVEAVAASRHHRWPSPWRGSHCHWSTPPLAVVVPWKPSPLVNTTTDRRRVVEVIIVPWKSSPHRESQPHVVSFPCRHQSDGRTGPGGGDGTLHKPPRLSSGRSPTPWARLGSARTQSCVPWPALLVCGNGEQPLDRLQQQQLRRRLDPIPLQSGLTDGVSHGDDEVGDHEWAHQVQAWLWLVGRIKKKEWMCTPDTLVDKDKRNQCVEGGRYFATSRQVHLKFLLARVLRRRYWCQPTYEADTKNHADLWYRSS